MIRLPKPAGLVPSALLFVCVLSATQSNAAPVPPVPADGTWREFNLLQVASPIAIYDGSHDQLLSVGGTMRFDNWALSLAGRRAWEPLPATPEQPLVQFATVDPSNELVYYLDFVGSGFEVHTLDPLTGTVTVIPGSRLPFAIPSATWMAFDPVDHRLVVFVGPDPLSSPSNLGQVWALDLTPTPAWSRWQPTGTPPPPRIRYLHHAQSCGPGPRPASDRLSRRTQR